MIAWDVLAGLPLWNAVEMQRIALLNEVCGGRLGGGLRVFQISTVANSSMGNYIFLNSSPGRLDLVRMRCCLLIIGALGIACPFQLPALNVNFRSSRICIHRRTLRTTIENGALL